MDDALSDNDRAAVILMYHDIVDDNETAPAVGDPVYNVKLETFQAQMRILRDGGHCVLSLSQFVTHQRRREPLPPGAVLITFDDGYQACHERALPALQDHGFVADFFLTVDCLEKTGYLSWDQARSLIDSGMGIGSHLMHHVYLDDLDSTTARRELVESKKVLEKNLGASVDFLAPPGGRMTDEAEKMAAEAGYLGICNSQVGINRLDQSPFRLRRVPIVGSTTLETFKSIVDQQRSTIWRQQTLPKALGLAKIILGNRRYDRVRERLLARRDVT